MPPTMLGGRVYYPLGFDRLLPGQGGAQQAERLPSACWTLQQSILSLQHVLLMAVRHLRRLQHTSS